MSSLVGFVFANGDRGFTEVVAESLRALPRFTEQSGRSRGLGNAQFGLHLSIRTPEDRLDRQPVVGAGRHLLVADIRIDNRGPLFQSLGQSYHQQADLADSELLLLAWAKWGSNCLNFLIGEFAFGIYDSADQSLYLARDALAQRPLFYAISPAACGFASMPSALLAADLFPASFNKSFLIASLLQLAENDDSTPFSAIRRVMPGELIRIHGGKVSRTRWWQPSVEPLSLSDDSFENLYIEHFSAAVSARMRRDHGQVAVQLSSGFDSSSVAAFAARSSVGELAVALTAAPRRGFDGTVPRGWMADESALAATTARRIGVAHQVIRAEGDPLLSLRSGARRYQEPDRNIVNMGWWGETLKVARQCGASVVLTATLGNLTIHAGGLPVLSQWLRSEGVLEWWRQANAAKNIEGVRWRGLLLSSFSHWLPTAVLNRLEQIFRTAPAPEAANFVRPGLLERSAELKRLHRREFDSGNYAADRLALLRSQDRGLFYLGALSEFGVEERDPTADRRLVEFSLRLPPSQMLIDGVARPLMRRALADFIPNEILHNSKRGLQAADWHEHLHPNRVLEVVEEISNSDLADELLDLRRLKRAVESWPKGGWNDPQVFRIYRRALTHALSTGVFIDEFEQAIRAKDFRRFGFDAAK